MGHIHILTWHLLYYSSVYCSATVRPLLLSESLLIRILNKYNISASFVPVLLSFGDAPYVSEGGSSNLMQTSTSDGLSRTSTNNRTKHALAYGTPPETSSYQLQYVERNLRNGLNPWSTRQTGVFHSATEHFDLYIVLHPTKDTIFNQYLESIANDDELSKRRVSALYHQPSGLHLSICSSYIDNWRWYLRDIGHSFKDVVSQYLMLLIVANFM